jgi:DNA-binding transcriptional regulator YhcF (GntR family)
MPATRIDLSRFTLRDDVPAHRQVAAYLKAMIALGELAPGAPVPAAPDLSSRLRVGAGEVRRAYGELEERGFLVSKAGAWRVTDDQGPGASAAAIDELRARLAELVAEGRRAGLSRAGLLRLFTALLDP